MVRRFNPYVIGSPVKVQAFYGREKLINVVRDTLAIGTVNLLVFFGQRRIGKTSLLQNLSTQTELNNFVFVYSDTVDIADKTSYETLAYFSQKIAQTLDLPILTKEQLQLKESLFQTEFLTWAQEKIGDKRLVLLLDEFDIFELRHKTGNGDVSNSALDVIKNLIENEPRLAFIVAFSRGKERLFFELSRITRTGHWEKVSLLEVEDTRHLIIEPADGQLAYLPEAVNLVLELSAGHPYYTQLVCYEIFNELQNAGGNEVRVSDVEKAAEKALVTGTGGFGWLWEDFSPAERLVSALLAEAAEGDSHHIITEEALSKTFEKNRIHRRGLELTGAIKQLINLDIIEQKGLGQYQYVIEIIRRWIHKNHPVYMERGKNLTLLSERAAAEFAAGQKANTPSEVIHNYQAAIAANPNHIEAQLALAAILLEQGRVDEAVNAFEAAYWLDEVKAAEGLEKAKFLQEEAQAHRARLNRIKFWGGGAIILILLIVGTAFFLNGILPGETSLTSTIQISSTPTPIQSSATPTSNGSLTSTSTPVPIAITITAATPQTPNQIITAEATTVIPPSPETATASSQLVPTSTSISIPTATLSPTFPPTSTPFVPPPTATSQYKYAAPVLIDPESDKWITPDQPEVILEWNSVGNLAGDEEYAVRLRFIEKITPQYSGDQTQSTSWAVRRDLFFNRADPPNRQFEWFVYVQKKDGTPLSPESEHRIFFWR